MKAQSSAPAAVGIISVAGKIHSQTEETTLRAMLEDLPGMQAVEFLKEGIRVTFNPLLTGENNFQRAIGRAGYVLRSFRLN